MQLTSLAAGGTAAGTPTAPAGSAAPDAASRGQPAGASPLRSGLRSQGSDVNQQVTSAQQALNYLDQLATQLRGLKAEISRELARPASAETAPGGEASSLQQQMRQLEALWRERSARAGGHLDNQLAYAAGEPARQRFKVQGLSLAALQAAGREKLSIAVAAGDGSTRTVSVAVEPMLSRQSLVRRFDQALAPAGLRAATDDGGELAFSVPEPLWAGVESSLAIKGSGAVFPTGQLHRVRAEPEAPALQPAAWNTGSTSALRHSLQDVVAALDRIRQAQDEVSRALTRAVQTLTHTGGGDDAAWAQAFSDQFGQLGEQRGYGAISTVAPALLGISRHRVLAMLSST